MSTAAQTHAFSVENIHCEACARRVKTAIGKIDPEAAVEVDVASGAVRVVSAGAAREALAEALKSAGYPART